MALLTPSQIQEVLRQIKPKFSDGLQKVKPAWDLAALATQDTCSQGEVILHWIDRLPILRDWTGISKELVNFSERGMRIRMRDLELTAQIKYKELERGNKRMLKIALDTVVQATGRYKHDLVTSCIYNNGLSVNPKHPRPDVYTGYDGVGLFGDHPINPDQPLTAKIKLPISEAVVLNTQSNLITGAPMSPTAWQEARKRARNFRDPRGINLGVEYDTAIIPPQLIEATYEAIGAKVIAVFPNSTSGASKENVNATVTLLSNGVMVLCMPELDDGTTASQTTWYPACRNHPSGIKPIEVMVEKEPFFGTNIGQVAGLSGSQEIATENVLFAASGRALAYATLWFLLGKATA